MDYDRIDSHHIVSLITWLPKVLVIEIVNFTHAKCVDCKHFLVQEYTCTVCGKIRCQLHQFINISRYGCYDCYNVANNIQYKTYVNCIIPQCYCIAWCGSKDAVYYCVKHSKNKQDVIRYHYCGEWLCFFVTNMIDVNNGCIKCIKHQDSNREYTFNYVKN